MPILPKFFYKLNIISQKIPADFFVDADKLSINLI